MTAGLAAFQNDSGVPGALIVGVIAGLDAVDQAPLCRAGQRRWLQRDFWARAYWLAGRRLAQSLRGGRRHSDRVFLKVCGATDLKVASTH